MIAVTINGNVYTLDALEWSGPSGEELDLIRERSKFLRTERVGYAPDTDLEVALLIAREMNATLIDLSKHEKTVAPDTSERQGIVY